jgi:hypothetical protein
MMNPSPSTPPKGVGTRQRQRIGGDFPFRDDPVSLCDSNAFIASQLRRLNNTIVEARCVV